MSRTLIAFHGFTLNGELMQSALSELTRELEPDVRVVCLNAPHACSEASVDGMYRALGGKRLPPPHLCWWNASDDGLEYRGWDETCDVVREALDRYAPAAVLGFSQGAILAAAVAALARTGELPHIQCAVLIAGRVPRAARFLPAFATPIALPSLHVWGERDALAGSWGPELAEHFSEKDREIAVWPGGHVVPKRGPAFAAMARFVREHTRESAL